MNTVAIVMECRARVEAAANTYEAAGRMVEEAGRTSWSLVFADLAAMHRSLSGELDVYGRAHDARTDPTPEMVAVASRSWDVFGVDLGVELLSSLQRGEQDLVDRYDRTA
jgi:hypothetical protein